MTYLRFPKARQDLFAEMGPAECWLLGLVWADGCLNGRPRQQRIYLHSVDEELVAQAADIAARDYSIRPDQRPNRKPTFRLAIGGRAVIERAVALGLTPAKSLTAEMPTVPHGDAFLRGYFDGDGTVGLYRNPSLRSGALPRLISGFIGSLMMIDQIQELLFDRAGIQRKRPVANKSVWIVHYNHADSLRLADFMYADGGPHLARKKRIFDEGAAQPFTPRRPTTGDSDGL